MQEVTNLTKGWSDSLSATTVGLLALLLPNAYSMDAENGRVVLELAQLTSSFAFVREASAGIGVIFALILAAVAFAFGSILTHFGELMAIIPDYTKRQRIKDRFDALDKNPALARMHENAYTSFRLLCGIGGTIFLYSTALLIGSIFKFEMTGVIFGATGLLIGTAICCWFARYSFTYLDWLVFGDLNE